MVLIQMSEMEIHVNKHGKNTGMCHRTAFCQRNDNLSTPFLLVKSKSLVQCLLKVTSHYCCPINSIYAMSATIKCAFINFCRHCISKSLEENVCETIQFESMVYI